MADAAATLLLKWGLGSNWAMRHLLLPASPLGARLHALTLELVGTRTRMPLAPTVPDVHLKVYILANDPWSFVISRSAMECFEVSSIATFKEPFGSIFLQLTARLYASLIYSFT